MSILFYRRPDYVNPSPKPLNSSECARYVERAKGSDRAIPAGLTFEDVMANRPLPPCSLSDFMDYLVHIEHSAENLQFLLWHKDYTRRFAALPANEANLSPVWDQALPAMKASEEAANSHARKHSSLMARLRDQKWEALTESSPSEKFKGRTGTMTTTNNDAHSFISTTTAPALPPTVAEANAQAGLKWQAFSIQPYRDECDRIMRHYLAFTSPRELNLSHRDRGACLHALQHTTHPSAFLPAVAVAEATLRKQSHPNFIRWSICNGNRPRVVAVRGMTTVTVVEGFVVAVVLTLSSVSRWWRILAAPLWFIGFAGLIASYKGICIILHHDHTRNLRPWEQLEDGDEECADEKMSGVEVQMQMQQPKPAQQQQPRQSSDTTSNPTRDATIPTKDAETTSSSSRPSIAALSPFGPRNSTSDYDGTPRWQAQYARKPILKKIFEKRSVWIQDETLRVLQDRIVLGSQVWAALVTVLLTILFVAVPAGRLF